ncbi:NAD(P)-dependent oxidoreductase [Anaerosporobacter sp.]
MKIYVYDVADFEEKIFAKLQKEVNDELAFSKESCNLETIEKAKGFDGITTLGYSKIDETILRKMKEYNIKYISTRTIGFDHIDVAKAKELGISVFHANYEPNNVADFTVMMMLILLRKAKVSICRALVNDFSLNGMQGKEMRSLTIGVIGTGKIGTTVIKNLSGFGCNIIAYDLYQNDTVKQYARYVSIEEIYKESDIITLHMPLTDSNYHMINGKIIEKMKKGVIIINTARGGLINTEDLISGLESGHVGGAGIDTLEEENTVMHKDLGTKIIDERALLYLKQFPNVLYTQHYGFFTEEATEMMARCGIKSIQLAAAGLENPFEIR